MPSRWTEEELKTIQDVFKDKDFVLSVRNVMLGFDDTFSHKTTDKVLGVLRKNLLPEYEPNVPLDHQQDLCHLSLNFITGFNFEEGIRRVEGFDIALDYLKRRFAILEGKEAQGETLKDLKDKSLAKDKEDRFNRMLAYLQIAGYVEKSLVALVTIAENAGLSNEEMVEKAKKDSSK